MTLEEWKKMLEATEFAQLWHADQKRKSSDIPYFSHLVQVQGLILEHGGDAGQAIAGLLHDSLEDTPDSRERTAREAIIEDRFGLRVLKMILTCTDTGPDEFLTQKKGWKERKDRYVAQLSSATSDACLVAGCDKRHNLHAIIFDGKAEGLSVFDRFTASPVETLWYYETVIGVIRDSLPRRLVIELDELLQALESMVENLSE